MTLPNEISNIFAQIKNSYKMVLVLSLLDEMNVTNRREVSYRRVKERFLRHLQERESRGQQVDRPPRSIASTWAEMNDNQIDSIINTPLEALSHIIEKNSATQTIGFKRELYDRWDQGVYTELYDYAQIELDKYYNQLTLRFSIREAFLRIMNNYLTAKTEPFASHQLGSFVRQTVPSEIRKLPFIHENFRVQGSVGQGNWAKVPWIAILDKRITHTTQQGEYIVYLFSEDMNSVYLTLAQGVTEPLKEGKIKGYRYLRNKVSEIRGMIPLQGMSKDENIYLTDGGLGQDYQVSTVAYYRYDKDNMPSDEQLISDLQNVVENYNLYVNMVINQKPREAVDIEDTENHVEDSLETKENHSVETMVSLPPQEQLIHIKDFISNQGFSYPDQLIENFYLSLKSKPFVILAGISGTGKTKLVKLFAEAIGATSDNGRFTIIPVRPDWSDPSDLIGYKDISGVFRPGPLTEVLVQAREPQNRNKPFFVCLDEMNLARVEHYFSDLLSILETAQWSGEEIITDSIIKREMLETVEDKQRYGNLYLPDNVYIIGTVNMDETTYPFSKKVLDRANTIEFNEIDLTQLPNLTEEDFASPVQIVPNSFLRSDYLVLKDAYAEYQDLIHQTTDKLVRVNQILESIHCHVGFRVRDAICFYLIYNKRFELMDSNDAFDIQLLQKILPRIQGSSMSVKRVLLQLLEETVGRKIGIHDYLDDASPLYSVSTDIAQEAQYPRSARKLIFMIRRLEEDGFTSYWLS